MSDPVDAPDVIDGAMREVRPEPRDVAAAVTRANVLAALFGRVEPVVVGRYAIQGRLGVGGGGEVFLARDPELSRDVALKLLHATRDVERLLAEGQALARLSHPNVVPVYDTGRAGDQVYVVMELVTGSTLRGFCRAPGRTVREILGAYRQAGAGLAAAHRAGFVHCDFKPDNAIVGDDGRVRVVDFGLARAGDRVAPVAGTPRYMAPEQRAGETLSAATDQFAFCVSLREGLETAGVVPRWIDAILRRGAAEIPTERFPSMDAMLVALSRDPASRWKRRGLVAGIAILAGGTFALGRTDRAQGPTCDPTAALGNAWDATTAASVAAHAGALRSTYAPRAVQQLSAMLGDYAVKWRDGHRDACIAHRDGAQSAAMFDRRVSCLSAARAGLASAAHIAATVTDDKLADAVTAVGALPDLERCANAAALTTAIAPPPIAVAARAAALADELAALEVEVRAARPDARARVSTAIAKARELRYAPLLARSLWLAGKAEILVDHRSESIAPLDESTRLALTVGDSALAVESFALRMWAAGTSGAPGDALAGADLMKAIADGLPDSERASRVVLENSFGGVALADGKRDRARDAFERALELSRGITGAKALEAAGTLSNLSLVIDDPARAMKLARERIAIVEAGVGAEHPLALTARISAALLVRNRAESSEQLERSCELLSRLHPSQESWILQCDFEIGWLAFERGDAVSMRVAFERVANMKGGIDDTRIAIARAHLARHAGRRDEADSVLRATLASLGPLENAAWWLLLRAGYLELARGNDANAIALLERVEALKPSVPSARRLAFARMRLGAAGAKEAIAWYRTAGGYDDAISGK